jgi:type II secretory pathway component GspD/PulD (secretin)
MEAVEGRGAGQVFVVRTGGGHLGVQVQKPGTVLADQLDLPKDQGLVIERVVPNSAAAKAGLKAHDVLLEFNGKPVPNEAAKFIKMVEEAKGNTPVDAVVLRKGKKETIKGIALGETKAKQERQPRSEGSSSRGRRNVITTMSRTNDNFTTRHQEGSLIITVTGNVSDGKGKVKRIEILDSGKRETYESVDKVPEAYRSKVKDLIEMSEKGNVKIESGANLDGTQGVKSIVIALDKDNAATLAQALARMLPQMRKNPIKLVIPGSGTMQVGRPVSSSNLPGESNHSLTLTATGNQLRADCNDQQALDLVRDLSRLLTQPEPREGDFEVIKLKKARAADAAKILDEAFNGNKPQKNWDSNRWFFSPWMNQQMKAEGSIRVVADPTTNSLLVRAKPLDMLTIRKMVEESIDNDKVNEKQINKNWKIGPLKHATAKEMYDLVKNIYKEHINNTLEIVKSGARRNAPLVKVDQNDLPHGVDLTVAYDAKTNSLFLNCNEGMYEEIKKLIDEADAEKVTPKQGY